MIKLKSEKLSKGVPYMKNKFVRILWWTLFVLLMIGSGIGIVWEIYPTIIPDVIFYPMFYAQWVVIPAFFIITIIKEKRKAKE